VVGRVAEMKIHEDGRRVLGGVIVPYNVFERRESEMHDGPVLKARG
jgi:hypothetical protein